MRHAAEVVRVGLTGGIGSGKSTVSALLAEHGAVVVDADELARAVLTRGSAGLAEVVAAFGRSVLTPEGDLDRAVLAAVVFNDAAARERLNAIVHPRVRAAAREREAAAGPRAVVVHDVPLLVETGQVSWYDEIVVVAAAPETQVQRLVERRGMTPEQARARMAAQASLQQKLSVATHVVHNDGPPEALRPQVEALWQRLRARAEECAGRRPP